MAFNKNIEERIRGEVTTSCLYFEITRDKDIIVNVINELAQAAWAHLENSEKINPAFASHGPSHILGLMSTFNKLLPSMKIKKNKDSSFLVLVYGAIIFHDIGMGISENIPNITDYQKLIITKSSRINHDTKSLIFLEKIVSDTDFEKKFPNWVAFWESFFGRKNQTYIKIMWLVLCRVCQSHGDPIEEWLNSESLNSYSLKNGGTTIFSKTRINFNQLLGFTHFSKIEQSLADSSTVLCFLDLIHFGKDRSFDISTELLIQYAWSENHKENRFTFFHYVFHEITTIEFLNSENINTAYYYSERDDNLMPFILKKEGPYKDLVYYGNQISFLKSLESLIENRINFNLNRGGLDIDLWKKINSNVSNLKNKLFYFHEIQDRLFDSKKTSIFEKYISHILWQDVILHEITIDKNSSSLSKQLGQIKPILEEGISLEEFYTFSKLLSNRNVILELIDDSVDSNILDFFFATLQLYKFKITTYNESKEFHTYLTTKGDVLFRDLRQNKFKSQNNTKSFILIDLSSGYEKEHITDIEENYNLNEDIQIIYLVSDPKVNERFRSNHPNVEVFKFEYSNSKILKEYSLIIGQVYNSELIKTPRLDSDASPVNTLLNIRKEAFGLGNFIEVCENELSNNVSEGRNTVLSSIIFLCLLELEKSRHFTEIIYLNVFEVEYSTLIENYFGGVEEGYLSFNECLTFLKNELGQLLNINEDNTELFTDFQFHEILEKLGNKSKYPKLTIILVTLHYLNQERVISFNSPTFGFFDLSVLPKFILREVIGRQNLQINIEVESSIEEFGNLDFKAKIGAGLLYQISRTSKDNGITRQQTFLCIQFLQFISTESSGKLSCLENFLCFQLVFHLYSSFLSHNIELSLGELGENDLVFLGIYEAILSDRKNLSKEHEAKILNQIFYHFVNSIHGDLHISNECLLFLDISFHYKHKIDEIKKILAPRFDELYFAYERSREPLEKRYSNDLVGLWINVRNMFRVVIDSVNKVGHVSFKRDPIFKT